MKFSPVLALATASAAFVLPNEQLAYLENVEVQSRIPSKSEIVNDLDSVFGNAAKDIENTFHRVSGKVESTFDYYATQAKSAFDEAYERVEDAATQANDRIHEAYFDSQGWLQSAKDIYEEEEDYSTLGHGHHGHHGPHPHKPNQTVYELIASSKYTTKLAKLISEYDDLVEALNGTAANYTVFAPTDRAFEKIPEHAPKPSKEFLKALLTYHVSPEFYPAGRVLVTRTIPTLLKSPALGKKPLPQRLSTNIGFHGLTVNYYSRVVAVNIFGSNGVIHGVDSILVPPPSVIRIIDLLPGEFSTLELGLGKTGLLKKLNTTDHNGGTFFAPSNFAFKKLGPRINAFLFSSYGLKYLEALLEYHVVPNNTLYSDAFYKTSSDKSVDEAGIPKGHFHVDLPTLLKDRSLSIDIARYGRLIEIKINSFSRVSIADGIAYDGVLHVVGDVIIPPKKLGDGSLQQWDSSSELTEEDLKERLEPFVKHSSYTDDL